MIYKVGDFAKLLDTKPQHIYTYGKRGKLIILGGMIDDENPVNKAFLSGKGVKINKETGETTKQQVNTNKTNTVDEAEDLKKLNGIRGAKLKEEYRYAKIRNERLEGKLIPVDVVGRSVAEVIARYKTMFVQQADQLIRDICNANQLSNDIMTDSISKLTDIANESSTRANFEAKKAIENSISDSLNILK